jgi:hypothetical protein
LKKKEVMPPPTPPQIKQKEETNNPPKRVKDESPRINHRGSGEITSRPGTSGSSLRRGSGNSQSRDALPISRDYNNRNMYQENYRSKEIYRSNENFQKLNHYGSQDRINHTTSTAAKTLDS